MPPKKKGKKKGKGKGKGKGNKAPPPPEVLLEDDKVDEMSKKFYTVQIIVSEQVSLHPNQQPLLQHAITTGSGTALESIPSQV